MSLARVLSVCAALAFLVGGQGCASPATRVVLISGRDDHGLVARPAVALLRSPNDSVVNGSAMDGSFVFVLREQNSWLYVRTIEAVAQEGWIDDHYARGDAVLIGRAVRVTFRDAAFRDGAAMVLVRTSSGDEWVSASALREVGAR
ncbi:MAG: hypothetical protein HY071_00595 [Chloroflexi bacterium]|nr:hypothetical protein [Chloroflexota bacterium]